MRKLFTKIKSHSLRDMLKEYAWLSRYTRQYKAEVLWYVIVGVLGTVLSLAGSVLSKHIIDAVTGADSGGILVALVFYVLMQLSQIATRAITGRINAVVSIRVNQQITAQVYDKLLSTDWESLSAYHSGDLITRVEGDVGTISSGVLGWVPELITRLLQFGGTLGLILYYDPTLALLALLSAPVTLLMSRYAIKMMRQHNQTMRDLNSQMTVFNEESFRHMLLIKSFNRTDTYSARHRRLQQEYKDVSLEYNRFTIQKNTILSLVGTVVALLCFIWSIYRLQAGHISFGVMTLFLQLSGTVASAFAALAALVPSAITTATAAGRVMAIMDLPVEERGDSATAETFIRAYGGTPLSVQMKDVTYGYQGGEDVLVDSCFRADSGEIVAIIGPSGEGKTTLLRLLLGIVNPRQGEVRLCADDGTSVTASPATRPLFAYVPQDNTLFSGTVAENLRLLCPDATDEQLYEALRLACADDFIRRLPAGLDTPIKEQGNFSEGQIQRLCIARALLSDAPILLMDEGTSALDTETERQVLENALRSRRGRTCIVTTHRRSVQEMSHRVYAIRGTHIEAVPAENT